MADENGGVEQGQAEIDLAKNAHKFGEDEYDWEELRPLPLYGRGCHGKWAKKLKSSDFSKFENIFSLAVIKM